MKPPLSLRYGIKNNGIKSNDNTKRHYYADYSDFYFRFINRNLIVG